LSAHLQTVSLSLTVITSNKCQSSLDSVHYSSHIPTKHNYTPTPFNVSLQGVLISP